MKLQVVRKELKDQHDYCRHGTKNPNTLYRFNFIPIETVVLESEDEIESLKSNIAEKHGNGLYQLRIPKGKKKGQVYDEFEV